MAHHLLQQQPKILFSVPVFLTPAFSAARSFSTSSSTCDQIKRGNRDKNKKRGVSAIRSTGPRQQLSVTKLGPLPKPVSDPSQARAAFEVDPNHGLWGFFNENKEALIPPSEEDSHGRPWSTRELSRKSLEELHKLFWTCCKEANVVRTRNNERRRLRVGYGSVEGEERIQNLKRTMHRIRQVLLQRHYAHFDAQLLLEEKFLYEIFPDVLQEHITPEKLGLDDSMTENTQSTEEVYPLDHELAPDSAISSSKMNASVGDQRHKLTE